MKSGPALGGNEQLTRSYGTTSHRADPYPFPPNSIHSDPLDMDRLRERVSLAFVATLISLVVATPLIAAWAMIQFR